MIAKNIFNWVSLRSIQRPSAIALNYLPPDKAQYAKFIVHFSKTWKDIRETHEGWHEKILEELNRAKTQ